MKNEINKSSIDFKNKNCNVKFVYKVKIEELKFKKIEKNTSEYINEKLIEKIN